MSPHPNITYRTQYFVGQNFRHQAEISTTLSDKIFSDKVINKVLRNSNSGETHFEQAHSNYHKRKSNKNFDNMPFRNRLFVVRNE